MTSADIPLGMRLKAQARWNQTEADWRRFLALEPEGCFVAEIDGEPVGTTAAFVFDRVAWVAMVLVDEAHRGRGIATALLHHALAWLDGRGAHTVRLDATAQGRPVYERLGFVGEYEVARFEGALQCVAESSHGHFKAQGETLGPQGISLGCVDASSSHLLAPLCDLDQQVTRTQRARFLQRLQAEPGTVCLVALLDGALSGYLMRRPGASAAHLGPCVALDEAAGLALLEEAAQGVRGPVLADIPLPNGPAIRWARESGLREQRRFLRMCRGRPLEDDPVRIWAGSGPEKG